MIALTQLDGIIFTLINSSWSNPFLDAAMPWITRSAGADVVLLWILLIAALKGVRTTGRFKTDTSGTQHPGPAKAMFSFFLFLSLIYGINAAAYNGLKHCVHRDRPFVRHTAIIRVSPETVSDLADKGSFPSGHACNAFMIAALFAETFRRERYIFYCLAAMVALSRVYVGVHYPGDVIAGACLGLVVTWSMLLFRPLRYAITHEDAAPAGLSEA